MKRFNNTGLMIAGQHYMGRIDRQVNAAVRMVEDGMYFTINHGRQYGKTTLRPKNGLAYQTSHQTKVVGCSKQPSITLRP